MLNIFVKNEKALKSLKNEFNNYLSLAVTLLKKEILTETKLQNYNKNYQKFVKPINNVNITVYIKPLEEIVILLPDSKHVLMSRENSILKAFEPYLKN